MDLCSDSQFAGLQILKAPRRPAAPTAQLHYLIGNATTPGDQAKTLFGTATGQAPGATTGNLVVNGFFAGATGDHIGAALNVTGSANTAVKVNSAQAFRQQ